MNHILFGFLALAAEHEIACKTHKFPLFIIKWQRDLIIKRNNWYIDINLLSRSK